MSFDDGCLKVKKCPVCSGSHEYDLEFIRKPIMAYLTPDKETDEVVTRVETMFPCPVKGDDFMEVVTVLHRIYERIDGVNPRLKED